MQNSRWMANLALAAILMNVTAPIASAQTASIDLDLSSTNRTVSATAQQGFSLPVTITEGGTTKSILPTDSLTPAESVAVFQVLHGGQQIVIGANGAATGGTFVVTPLAPTATSLVIPQGVTGIHDAGVLQAINLSGNLVNSGSLYALSQNPAVTSATFSAANITNQQSGLISTVLPTGGLPGFAGANSQLSLILTAAQNVVNYGTISSAANLTVTAGNTITNGAATAATTAAVMQAVNNVNLTALSGNIINHGTIASLASNINLSAATAALVVNNVGGTLSALNGTINVRDSLFTGSAATRLWGGDYLSQALNINGGAGAIDIDANTLSGILNIKGDCAHVTASSLRLGDVQLTGDPTFYAFASFIELNNNLSFPGQHLALIASTDVRIKDGSTISIDTSSSSGAGGQLNVFAGANFTGFPPTETTNIPPSSGTTANIVVLDGNRMPGGQIDFRGVSSINTSGSTNGGNVNLLAWAPPSDQPAAPDAGRIRVAGSITATGGTGVNGRVTAIGGGLSGTAVALGDVNNNGIQNGTGGIFIRGDNPTFSGCTTCGTTPPNTNGIQISSLGNISSGRINTDENYLAVAAAGASSGNLASASNIAVSVGGAFKGGTITSMGSNSFGSSANTLNGGKVLIVANRVSNTGPEFHIGTVATNGVTSITVGSGTSSTGITKQGDINVVSGSGVTLDSWSDVSYTGSGQQGGNFSLSNGSSGTTVIPTNVTVPGGTLDMSATSGNALGGNIFMRANHVITQGALTLKANGSGTGAGGTVQLKANQNDQGGIQPGGSLTVEAKSTSGLGGVVRLYSWDPVDYSAGLDVNASSGGPGAGGQIEVDSVKSLGTANFDATSTTGTGGSIYVQGHPRSFVSATTFAGTLARNWSTGASQVNLNASGSYGGHVGFGGANLTTGTGLINLDAHATDAVGTSRQIDIWGNAFTMGSGGLTANANHGGGNSYSSSIDIASINNQANGSFSLTTTASDSSGWGGNVNVWINTYTSAGTALTIDTRGFNGAYAGDVTIQNANSGINNTGATANISIAHLNVLASNTAPGAPKNGSAANTFKDAAFVNITAAGDIALPDLTLDVASNGGAGTSGLATAGKISIVSGGELTLNSTSLSADGGPSGAHGGSVTVSASSIINGQAHLLLSANGSLTGNGGEVFLIASGSAQDLFISSTSGFSLNANSGGTGGSGGQISASAGRKLTLNSGSISADPMGANGNGGSISLRSGLSGTGTLDLQSQVTADGKGTGRGGIITLSYANSVTFGVNYNLTAKSLGTAPGGTISIANTARGSNGELLPLNVLVSGNIDASSVAGALGSFTADAKVTSSSTTLSAPVSILATGSIIAASNVHGSTIDISLIGSGQTFTIGQLESSGGTSSHLNVEAATIRLLPSSACLSTGSMTLTTASLTNDGTITVSGDLQINRQGDLNLSLPIANQGRIAVSQMLSLSARQLDFSGGGLITAQGISEPATTDVISFVGSQSIATVLPLTLEANSKIVLYANSIVRLNETSSGTSTIKTHLLELDSNARLISGSLTINGAVYNASSVARLHNDGSIEANSIQISSADKVTPIIWAFESSTGSRITGNSYIAIDRPGGPIAPGDDSIFWLPLISFDGNHQLTTPQLSIRAKTVSIISGGSLTTTGNCLLSGNSIVVSGALSAPSVIFTNTSRPLPDASPEAPPEQNLYVSGNGSVSSTGQVSLQSSWGLIDVNLQSISGSIVGTSHGSFSVNAHSDLAFGNVTSLGTASLTTSAGNILIDGTISVANGALTLTANQSAGEIKLVDRGSNVPALSTAIGNIVIEGHDLTVASGSGGITAGLVGNSLGAGSISIQVGGQANIAQSSLTGTSITVVADSLDSSAAMTATAGSIALRATNTLSVGGTLESNAGNIYMAADQAGTIVLKNGLHAKASSVSDPTLGNVFVTVGAPPAEPWPIGSSPANVTAHESANGKIYWGQNGISAMPPTNNLFAEERTIKFSTGSSPSSSILLSGAVTLIADPPGAGSLVSLPRTYAGGPTAMPEQTSSVPIADAFVHVESPSKSTLSAVTQRSIISTTVTPAETLVGHVWRGQLRRASSPVWMPAPDGGGLVGIFNAAHEKKIGTWSVTFPRRTIVWLDQTGENFCIRILSDSSRHGVIASNGAAHTIALHLGDELRVGGIRSDKIPVRNSRQITADIQLSQFSLFAMLFKNRALAEMRRSCAQRKLYNRIAKDWAAFSIATANRGRYNEL